MGGCASRPKGIDLTKEALPVDNPAASPSKPAETPQTVTVTETGNGVDVEKKEVVAVDNKAGEAKPEAATVVEDNKPVAEVKTESSPVETVVEKKEAAKVAITEERKAEAVVAPTAEIAEKVAEPSKVEEKTAVSPVAIA